MTGNVLTSPCRVAVVGAGYFGAFHYDAWNRIPEANLVAVVETDPERAQPLAEKYGTLGKPLPVFTTAEETCQAVSPDLVDITSPPQSHLGLIEELAPHVGHIICQKPFCGDLESAVKAIEICAQARTRLAVHENVRFQPWYREAKRLLDADTLGEIYQITFRLRPGDGQGDNAYLDRQPYFQSMPRFLVHETAIHWIDTFRYLLGEVASVSARLIRRNMHIAGEDSGLIQFEFDSGATGVFDGNRLADHAAGDCRLTMGEMLIEGSDATLRLDGGGALWLRKFGASQEMSVNMFWSDHYFGGDCVFTCTQHILSSWLSGEDAETEAHRYIQNQRIEELVYRSAESGAWQSLESLEGEVE